MLSENGRICLSASDLMRFISCTHASHLDLEQLQDRGPEPAKDSEDAALPQRHADAHEAEHLETLRAGGYRVEIERDQPFSQAVATTVAALREGPTTVIQGALEGGAWGGWSAFLERVDVPSDLGPYSDEVAETRLKRKPSLAKTATQRRTVISKRQ